MEALFGFLSDVVFPFVQGNGVAFSALVAAVAFAYKTRLEVKKSIRHTLFLVIQVRIAAAACMDDIQGEVTETVDSMLEKFQELGVPVDDESRKLNEAEARKYGSSLEERFFELDGVGFKDAIRNATAELSKSDPLMANKITFISKLPAVLESQKEYIRNIEKISESLSDQSLPKHVIENTRNVCRRFVEKKNTEVTQAILSEVDDTLLTLAEGCGFAYKKKVEDLIRHWGSEEPNDFPEPELGELEELINEIVGEIAILNTQYENTTPDSTSNG